MACRLTLIGTPHVSRRWVASSRRKTGVAETNEESTVEYSPPYSRPQTRQSNYVNPNAWNHGWSDTWRPYPADPRTSEVDPLRPSVGYAVPYKFRVAEPPVGEGATRVRGSLNRPASPRLTYTDFAGNRMPTLSTEENYRYWKDRGLDRLLPRTFPLHLDTHRKLDPLFREYIWFLHVVDPARFSLARIGERYGLKTQTVRQVCDTCSGKRRLRRTGLVSRGLSLLKHRREIVEDHKEYLYAKRMGYDQMGDEEIRDERHEQFQGHRGTADWVRQQRVEVEVMSAFPLPGKLDPMPKRVDVDLPVAQKGVLKIVSWVDPNDKIDF